jgi:hypothetical protein
LYRHSYPGIEYKSFYDSICRKKINYFYMSHDNEAIKKAFNKQSSLMNAIYSDGMEKYAAGIADLDKAFSLEDKAVRCIDEGTPGGLHLAGSGILLGVEKAAEALKKAGCSGISSHDECGAAGIYARANNLDASKSDEYGKEFALKLAEKMGVPYEGHIEIGAMKRPSGFHTARVCYYDGTGKFDPALCGQLPAGFVVSRRYVDGAYALEEVKVAVGIATGGHGYGELITAEAPFLIIAIGDSSNPEFSLANLQKELAGVAESSEGKVKVDGFTI